MIIPQMSEAELLEEIRLDLPNVVSISDTKDTKVRRIIQKSVLFPIYLHSFVTSPRKNKWIILWEARNKKNIGDNSLITFLCYQETPHGRYVFMPTWSNGSLILIVYPPHFFSRFAERMSLDVTGVNLIRRYFEKNNSYTFETEDELISDNLCRRNIYGSSLEGVAMGVEITGYEIILFKTFITYDMTKGQQISLFARNEEIRREIHEKIIIENGRIK
ncbi:hypothetical protein [Bacteroides thetaiotaomicron]|jgi:hypothetical protein|uniref:hypothetical protein n=1 Tax=Bacteroides thetaiotaomicron TaxID=818 RepID=UPI00101C1E42|nr:hypothetical protein [Bacteroides thetaiotaomicron]